MRRQQRNIPRRSKKENTSHPIDLFFLLHRRDDYSPLSLAHQQQKLVCCAHPSVNYCCFFYCCFFLLLFCFFFPAWIPAKRFHYIGIWVCVVALFIPPLFLDSNLSTQRLQKIGCCLSRRLRQDHRCSRRPHHRRLSLLIQRRHNRVLLAFQVT